jgi:hypothetical protein
MRNNTHHLKEKSTMWGTIKRVRAYGDELKATFEMDPKSGAPGVWKIYLILEGEEPICIFDHTGELTLQHYAAISTLLKQWDVSYLWDDLLGKLLKMENEIKEVLDHHA